MRGEGEGEGEERGRVARVDCGGEGCGAVGATSSERTVRVGALKRFIDRAPLDVGVTTPSTRQGWWWS